LKKGGLDFLGAATEAGFIFNLKLENGWISWN